MLKFNCYSCGEYFQVSFENLYNKISIQCPNCDNALSNQTVALLRKFSEAYMDVIDSLCENNTHKASFGLSVTEMLEPIPNRPSEYPRLYSKSNSYWKHRQKQSELNELENAEVIDDPDLPF